MIGGWASLATGTAVLLTFLQGGPTMEKPTSEAPQGQSGGPRITVIYDNTAGESRFRADWGFSALIEYRGHTLLMDGGTDPAILRRNMDSLGIAASRIEAVVLTHAHGDHAGGLSAVEDGGARRRLYVLAAFPREARERLGRDFALVDAAPGQELIPGVFTTGEMVDPAVGVPEQSLVIRTDSGLVIVTGCAHQGIVSVVRRATETFGGPVRLVMGGFHLLEKSPAEVGRITSDFRAMGVRRVGATHCTGDAAIAAFREAYGADYVQLGAGRVLDLGR